jgi:hypothetical protein
MPALSGGLCQQRARKPRVRRRPFPLPLLFLSFPGELRCVVPPIPRSSFLPLLPPRFHAKNSCAGSQHPVASWRRRIQHTRVRRLGLRHWDEGVTSPGNAKPVDGQMQEHFFWKTPYTDEATDTLYVPEWNPWDPTYYYPIGHSQCRLYIESKTIYYIQEIIDLESK